jgi:hypothetical protein
MQKDTHANINQKKEDATIFNVHKSKNRASKRETKTQNK